MVFPTEDEQNKLLDMVNLPEERELRVLTHCPIAKTNCKWFVGRGSHWVCKRMVDYRNDYCYLYIAYDSYDYWWYT